MKNALFVCYCFRFVAVAVSVAIRGKEKLALVSAPIHMPHTFNRPFISIHLFIFVCVLRGYF